MSRLYKYASELATTAQTLIMKSTFNTLAIFFGIFAASINAQYVVTVVHQEIVTVTYNPVQSTASLSGNTGGMIGAKDIQTGDDGDDEESEQGINNEYDDLNGRINARQTSVPSESLSTKTKAMTKTKAQKTGASSSNSADSLKGSMLVGSLAVIALLGLLL